MHENEKSVFIKTFGCQMNVYDSDRMLSVMLNNGFSKADTLENADIVILNTCSVRGKAEHKVLSLLGQLKPFKQKKADRVLGVSGCVSQRMGRELLQKAPHLDLVFGPDSVDRVDELVNSVLKERVPIVSIDFEDSGREYSEPVDVHKARPSEFLTVVKGCDQFCSYCIVPYVRGREKSRSIDEILGDVKRLVQQGTKEVIFLGQNINTYGRGTPYSLSQVVFKANAINDLERIRYVTSHPYYLGDDLIAQFGSVAKLSPQLHLPLQSGNNRILRLMSRRYTWEVYLAKVEALRKVRPDIALSTDIIVGFPGETDADFEDTLKLARGVGFSQAFMFKYSPRPGTRAFNGLNEPEVLEGIKEERLAVLQQEIYRGIEKQNSGLVGTRELVLIESLDRKGRFYSGRDLHGRIVHVLDADQSCVGSVIEVKITEANVSNLKGVCRERAGAK